MYRLVTKERILKALLSVVILLGLSQISFVVLDLLGFNIINDRIAHWILNRM
jgi:hypothetical protein